MSGTRMLKKDRNTKSTITIDSSELKSIISSFLVPITNSLNNLNEKVMCLVNSLNKRGHNELLETSFEHELHSSSITAVMIAEETQNLSKNYSSLKEQVSTYQQNLQQINEKLASMDKLLCTLVKRQTKNGLSDEMQVVDAYISSINTGKTGVDQNAEFKAEVIPKALDVKSMEVFSLNTADDFPQGSWLGDPESMKGRVRCPISPKNLLDVNFRCKTAQKMALTLLDLLFSKETLSISNISGKSKLGKKKLDPLMIYGIKCHLIHHFGIDEKQWERIKINMDSKCRTAWRKRQAEPGFCISVESDAVYAEDSQSKDSDYVPILQDNESGMPKKRILRTLRGDIEVFSSDQILRFQDFHNIQVLDGESILPMESDGESENEMSLNGCVDQSQLAIVAEDNRQDSVSFVMEPMMGSPLTNDHELLEDQDR